MWDEYKSLVPLAYRTNSFEMQLKCHMIGRVVIGGQNVVKSLVGMPVKTSYNLETWHPDGNIDYYVVNKCNPGGTE